MSSANLNGSLIPKVCLTKVQLALQINAAKIQVSGLFIDFFIQHFRNNKIITALEKSIRNHAALYLVSRPS